MPNTPNHFSPPDSISGSTWDHHSMNGSRLPPFTFFYVGNDDLAISAIEQSIQQFSNSIVITNVAKSRSQKIDVIIVDQRSRLPSTDSKWFNNFPGIPKVALVPESYLKRRKLFSHGFQDYLFWPLLEDEVVNRLGGCIWQTERDERVSTFSTDPIVQKACEYLVNRMAQRTSLVDLAVHAASNRTSLVCRFKTEFGLGPISWLTQYRMNHASLQLRTTRISVQDIANSVGYPNSNNFSTAFKAIHGMAPLKYRNSALGKENPVRRKGIFHGHWIE